MQISFGAVTPSRFWFVANFCHSVITPVDPCRPVPTQLSLSLTNTDPANFRLPKFVKHTIGFDCSPKRKSFQLTGCAQLRKLATI